MSRPPVPDGYRSIRDQIEIPAAPRVTISFRSAPDSPNGLEAQIMCLTCDEPFVWIASSRWFECESCEAELTVKEFRTLVTMATGALSVLGAIGSDPGPLPPALIPTPRKRSIWDLLMFWRKREPRPV